MTQQLTAPKAFEVLRTAAAYHARVKTLMDKARAICARSAEQRALTEEQLHRTTVGLHESAERLRRINAAECAYTVAEIPATPKTFAVDTNHVSPSQIQLPAYVLEPPQGREWIHELKQEGYRLLCRRNGKDVVIADSAGRDWSANLPSLGEALLALPAHSLCIDGDAVCLNDDGLSCRIRLDEALLAGQDGAVLFFAFDLLHLNGRDIGHLSLLERKTQLRALLRRRYEGKVRYAAHLRQNGKRMLEQAYLLGLEGIVSKRGDAPYRAGIGLDWRLTKCSRRH
jgi:ATP-dependent DNA ligase